MKFRFDPVMLEWGALTLYAPFIYFGFFSKRRLPFPLLVPGRLLRLLLALVAFGLLVGCTNPDPLAVATGPLYPLNVGLWHPTPHDLAAPPQVAHN